MVLSAMVFKYRELRFPAEINMNEMEPYLCANECDSLIHFAAFQAGSDHSRSR